MVNNIDTTETPSPAAALIVPKINIKPINTSTTICPASIFAKRRIINANGFVNTPMISIICIKGKTGVFKKTGTSGQKISFQYSLFPEKLVIKKVMIAKTKVTAMLPVMFAPPGNIGINPNKLLKKMKKKTVSR